jgi:hypothetical protein
MVAKLQMWLMADPAAGLLMALEETIFLTKERLDAEEASSVSRTSCFSLKSTLRSI